MPRVRVTHHIPFLHIENVSPPDRVSRWLFLRLLGVVYLLAFTSLWPQMLGLVGSQGILPASHLLEAAASQFGAARFWAAPTLCWISSSDACLRGLCAAGVIVACGLILDIAPAMCLGALWVLYLSMVTIGQDFLGFQWDNLLLEAGWLSIFFAPLRCRPRWLDDSSPVLVRWLLRWLLFRLMFSSGLVKFLSGDPAWRSLTALTSHYGTQPLPTWIGWYAHQMPPNVQRASCAIMFVIELVVPWLIFGSMRCRHVACLVLLMFQGLIAATGNYGFFNLLTVSLCVVLLDDTVWPARVQEWVNRRTQSRGSLWRWPWWVFGPVAGIIMVVSGAQMADFLPGRFARPKPLVTLERLLSPFRSINRYGLFAVMTMERPEILIEGSDDGTFWKAYAFRYKPGEVTRRPAFVAPHQPRLDWQMWFAALSSYQQQPWFLQFCEQLLRGSPAVLGLLEENPFPDRPPRYLRAVVYDYRFTDFETRRASLPVWWHREMKGFYCPLLSLPDDHHRTHHH